MVSRSAGRSGAVHQCANVGFFSPRAGRELEAGVANRGPHPLPCFLDGPVREPNDGEAGESEILSKGATASQIPPNARTMPPGGRASAVRVR
jgi:hypothetical protein